MWPPPNDLLDGDIDDVLLNDEEHAGPVSGVSKSPRGILVPRVATARPEHATKFLKPSQKGDAQIVYLRHVFWEKRQLDKRRPVYLSKHEDLKMANQSTLTILE